MTMDTMHAKAASNSKSSTKRKPWVAAQLLLAFGSFVLLIVTAGAASRKAAPRAGGWNTAQLTTYTSYPFCCEDSPVYDPNADKTECEQYNGCMYQGEFAVLGHKPFEWVKNHNIVAFYDDRDKNGEHFHERYGGKTIKLRKDGKEFAAIIADTCGNQDCDNCCTRNSQGGFLVDMEYWTAERNLGGAGKANGTIEFQVVQ